MKKEEALVIVCPISFFPYFSLGCCSVVCFYLVEIDAGSEVCQRQADGCGSRLGFKKGSSGEVCDGEAECVVLWIGDVPFIVNGIGVCEK